MAKAKGAQAQEDEAAGAPDAPQSDTGAAAPDASTGEDAPPAAPQADAPQADPPLAADPEPQADPPAPTTETQVDAPQADLPALAPDPEPQADPPAPLGDLAPAGLAGQTIKVRGPEDGRYRAGLKFGPIELEIDLSHITRAQLKEIVADRYLRIRSD